MFKIGKYCNEDNVDTLVKKRRIMNIGSIIAGVFTGICLINVIILENYLMLFMAICFGILFSLMVIKRELYSMMIFLKSDR